MLRFAHPRVISDLSKYTYIARPRMNNEIFDWSQTHMYYPLHKIYMNFLKFYIDYYDKEINYGDPYNIKFKKEKKGIVVLRAGS